MSLVWFVVVHMEILMFCSSQFMHFKTGFSFCEQSHFGERRPFLIHKCTKQMGR